MSQFTLPAQQLSTPEGVKSFAFALRDTLTRKGQDYRALGNIKCLHAVSEGFGFDNWNQLEGMLSKSASEQERDGESKSCFDGLRVVKATAESQLQELKDYFAYQLIDESIDENPQLRYVLASIHEMQKAINGIESEDLRDSMPHCKACGTSLMEPESVMRQYLPKDEGLDEVFAGGHYDMGGEFQVDAFEGFGGGRYDLHDDSDFCAHCSASV